MLSLELELIILDLEWYLEYVGAQLNSFFYLCSYTMLMLPLQCTTLSFLMHKLVHNTIGGPIVVMGTNKKVKIVFLVAISVEKLWETRTTIVQSNLSSVLLERKENKLPTFTDTLTSQPKLHVKETHKSFKKYHRENIDTRTTLL